MFYLKNKRKNKLEQDTSIHNTLNSMVSLLNLESFGRWYQNPYWRKWDRRTVS